MGSLLPCATAQEPWWPKSPDFYDVFFIDQIGQKLSAIEMKS
jgi:hypothetical protein